MLPPPLSCLCVRCVCLDIFRQAGNFEGIPLPFNVPATAPHGTDPKSGQPVYDGLFFAAYTHNLQWFDDSLDAMIGQDKPKHEPFFNDPKGPDLLLYFTQAVTGTFWYMPNLWLLFHMWTGSQKYFPKPGQPLPLPSRDGTGNTEPNTTPAATPAAGGRKKAPAKKGKGK